jgi:alkylation response protein AidB-like acyl-CoA dehydrogenase
MSAAATPIATPATGDDVGEMLRQSVQDFCARHSGVVRTRRLRETEPGYDAAIWRQIAQAGWTGIGLPEANGGSGLALAEICIVAEELAADLAPEPFAAATIGALAISRGDNLQLRTRLLPAICSGELIASLAWQEAENTLDVLHPATRLVEAGGGGFLLHGEKRFVPAASSVGGFAVTAAAPSGPVLVWIAADARGVSNTSDLAVDGSRLHTLRFDGVDVDHADVIASASAARSLLRRLRDEAVVIASAELLGIVRAAFERTRTYVGQRTQFGKPIGSFQVLQHRLVDLWMQRELVRACLEEAIDVCGQLDEARRALSASAVKARASAAALHIGRQSIQLHGAIGYADEHDIGLYLKRAIVKSAWLGNAPVHRKRFARLSGYSLHNSIEEE